MRKATVSGFLSYFFYCWEKKCFFILSIIFIITYRYFDAPLWGDHTFPFQFQA